MHGYAKIKLANGTRSKSVDLSHLHPFPQTQQSNENMSPEDYLPEIEKPKEIKNTMNDDHFFSSEVEYEDEMKLSRNGSVSSTASQRFRLDRQSSSKKAIQSAVKRAFPISRSSSVSERYCRIHVQGGVSPLNDEGFEYMEGDAMQIRSMKKKKKYRGGSILKVCKRLFGL